MVEPLGPAALGHSVTGARVLVVEDDADMRRAIRDVFQMYGFAVNTTRDGNEAFKLAMSERYDVVVSDIRLPGMSGVDLTRRILSHRTDARVVLITAYPEWKVYKEAYEAGALKVVSKPFTLARLAECVEQIARGEAPNESPKGSTPEGRTP